MSARRGVHSRVSRARHPRCSAQGVGSTHAACPGTISFARQVWGRCCSVIRLVSSVRQRLGADGWCQTPTLLVRPTERVCGIALGHGEDPLDAVAVSVHNTSGSLAARVAGAAGVRPSLTWPRSLAHPLCGMGAQEESGLLRHLRPTAGGGAGSPPRATNRADREGPLGSRSRPAEPAGAPCQRRLNLDPLATAETGPPPVVVVSRRWWWGSGRGRGCGAGSCRP